MKLPQTHGVERQEKQMQNEHGVQVAEEAIGNEGHVAGDGDPSQGNHGLHIERRKDE
jgi:hypothetical protein